MNSMNSIESWLNVSIYGLFIISQIIADVVEFECELEYKTLVSLFNLLNETGIYEAMWQSEFFCVSESYRLSALYINYTHSNMFTY